MKNNLFLLLGVSALSFLFFSCSSGLEKIEEYESKDFSFDEISIDEALFLANQVADFLAPGSNSSRSNVRRATEVLKVETTLESRYTESGALIYAVNYENEQGYALVSAKVCNHPILAVIDSGSYNGIDPNNKVYNDFIKRAASYVDQHGVAPLAKEGDRVNLTEMKIQDDTLENAYVRPKIKNKWNQKYPANLYCPNKRAGCAPIALAAVLSHFEAPASMAISYPNSDYCSLDIDWVKLKKHMFSDDQCGCKVADKGQNHSVLGKIARQLGYKTNTTYRIKDGDTITSTNRDEIMPAIKYYLPHLNVYDFRVFNWNGIVSGVRREVVLLAANIEENGTVSNSHMWIADGCKSFRVVNRIYTRENGQSIWKVLEEHEIAKEHLLHHWWGWGGYNDGWFNEAIMNFIPNENKQDPGSIVLDIPGKPINIFYVSMDDPNKFYNDYLF